MRRRFGVVFLLLSLGLAGCGFMPGAAPNFEGTGWRAISVAGSAPVPGSEPTVRFEGGKIVGSTGCNQYGGLAKIEGTRLTITDLGSTLIGCGGKIADVEKLFVRVMSVANAVHSGTGNLVIDGPAGEVEFRPDPTVR